MRTLTLLRLLLVTTTLACGGSPQSPTGAPTPTPTPAPTPTSVPATFTDPATSFSTQDVRDVQGQIMRFDTASNSLIWTPNGQSYAGFPVIDTYFIRADKFFQVRFGKENGQPHAYFTEAGRGTLCDVEVSGSGVVITPTDVQVPNS